MKDLGKHLFLLLVTLILLVGIYLSYNSPTFNLSSLSIKHKIEGFTTSTLYPEPVNFKIIDINKTGITVEFNPPPPPSNSDGTIPSPSPQLVKYCIILASMDDKGAIVNGQRMFLQPVDNCTNPDIKNTSLPESQRFLCNYKISLVPNENEVSFKAGLMAIYDTGNSNVINPSNINIFRLELSLGDNINIFNEGVAALKSKQKMTSSILNSQNVIGTADGQFEMIKQSLGGYPDNLYIEQSIGEHTLSDAINKQLSLGVVNLNLANAIMS
jgi:hypothetical protein